MRVILIRPGATNYDQQGRILGTLDVPLNELGQRQVEQSAQDLEDKGISAIYCSGNESARRSAETIGRSLDIKVRTLNGLRNLDHGLWQGQQVEEIQRKHPKVYRQWVESPASVCPPEGESMQDAYARVARAMKQQTRRHRGEVIALVCPEPVASLIRCWIAGKGLDGFGDQPVSESPWEQFAPEPEPS